jgi:hypothetical protein
VFNCVYSLTIAAQFKTLKPGKYKMTKAQLKQLAMIEIYIDNKMPDTAARSISSLIRSAMTSKSKQALMQRAIDLNLTNRPEFII